MCNCALGQFSGQMWNIMLLFPAFDFTLLSITVVINLISLSSIRQHSRRKDGVCCVVLFRHRLCGGWSPRLLLPRELRGRHISAVETSPVSILPQEFCGGRV
ncbi:hypothetical protein JOB18_012025 [Solea senegalensis]|uniref:Uncharacterized protein n=1 Tax=Solea senegalensis TaxID=28829 RepID=A0AAV6PNE2_SOLSE|nr:hypothetical protein JOB18_012025 [Solea senegalensis]